MNTREHSPNINLSIIVPVYNATRHIERCVENVRAFHAEYPNMEAIFIDDASGDGSYEVLQNYADDFAFIHTSRLDINGGPGLARNLAIEMASGEYLFFLDVDDGFIPEKLVQLMAFAKRKESQVVAFDCDIINVSGSVLHRKDFDKVKQCRDARIRSFLRSDMDGSVIFTLFKKSFFREHFVTFPIGIHEDMPVIFKAYFYQDRIDIFDERVYIKNSESDSIVHSIGEAHIVGIFRAYLIILRFLRARNYDLSVYADDARYGFTGGVANLLLKIVFGAQSAEDKAGLARSVWQKVQAHDWLFFGRYGDETQKDKVVLKFVELFQNSEDDDFTSSYNAFDGAIRTMIDPHSLSPVIAHHAQ